MQSIGLSTSFILIYYQIKLISSNHWNISECWFNYQIVLIKFLARVSKALQIDNEKLSILKIKGLIKKQDSDQPTTSDRI